MRAARLSADFYLDARRPPRWPARCGVGAALLLGLIAWPACAPSTDLLGVLPTVGVDAGGILDAPGAVDARQAGEEMQPVGGEAVAG